MGGSELPTEGPFARFKANAPVESTSTSSPSTATPAQPKHAQGRVTGRSLHEEGRPAVETHNLEFCYPGIGEPS